MGTTDKKTAGLVAVTTEIGGPPGSSTHKGIRITQRGADEASAQTVEVAVSIAVRNRAAALASAECLRRAADELEAIAARPWAGRREAAGEMKRGRGRPPKDKAKPAGKRGPGRPPKSS